MDKKANKYSNYDGELKENINLDDNEFDMDEESDDLYRPKKRNNRKQMLSLFVYNILREKTNKDVHMSQQDIMICLQEMPYELTVERKALSRVIHGLEDEFLGIHSNPKGGTWFDENRNSWDPNE